MIKIRTAYGTRNLKEFSVPLLNDKWVSLKKVVCPEHKIYGYTYSSETRCNGQIVAFVPFRKTEFGREFLFRCEATPCWNFDCVDISSFTGGVDEGMNVRETVLKELTEESGFEINDSDLIDLGQTFASKSSDSIYHLFSMDLSKSFKSRELEYESELEKSSYCKWLPEEQTVNIVDPFALAILYRLKFVSG